MKRLALAAALSVLAGCASTVPAPDQPSQPVQKIQALALSDLSELNYVPLQVFSKAIQIETVINEQSELLSVEGGVTAVAAWKLPDYGVNEFQLESFIQRTDFGNKASAFMAELWLLDDHFEVIKKLPAQGLDYGHETRFSREALTEQFVIDNRKSFQKKPVYIVALTTPEARGHRVMVANLDAEYAKVKGVMPPPVPDVFATAAEQGALRLTVTPLISHSNYAPAIKKPAVPDTVPTAAVHNAHENGSGQVPVSGMVSSGSTASGSTASGPSASGPSASGQMAFDSELEKRAQVFLQGVSQALADQDTGKAMALRRGLKRTQAELQLLFESSYGAGHEALAVKLKEYPLSKDNQTIDQYLKHSLLMDLRRGRSQSALALLDRSEQLIWQVNQLF